MKEKKFSRFLIITLLGLIGLSLTFIVGSLYSVLSLSMENEFTKELKANEAEISLSLNEHFNIIQARLKEISLNNAIRVNLLLGLTNQLHDILEKQDPIVSGVTFLIKDNKSNQFIPGIPSDYKSVEHLFYKIDNKSSFQSLTFQKINNGPFISLFSLPIKRKTERLGTAFAVCELAKDKKILERFKRYPDSSLMIAHDKSLINILSKHRLELPPDMWNIFKQGFSETKINLLPDKSFVPLKKFPGLFYASSSTALHRKKLSLLVKLAVLCSGILFLTLLVALLIAKRVSNPLTMMADQAMEISQNPSNFFLQENNLQYSEFQKLAQAFNKVLLNLMKAQQELEKRTQMELDASEKLYRQTLETAPDSIVISRISDGKYLEVNNYFCQKTGYTREEAINKSPLDLNLYVNPDDRTTMARILKEDGELNAFEVQYRTKSGEILDSLVSARYVKFSGEDCVVSVVTDITEQKHAEKEKSILEKQLHQSQKMEAIGMLAGGVAHDLNNILTGLVGYPEILLLKLPPDSPNRKYVHTIKSSGEKAAAIVQDLLTLARRGAATTEVINMNHVIRDFLKSPEFQKIQSFYPGVTVETNLDPNLFNISASTVHLSKTVMNLVSNAAEAMLDGGSIRISSTNQYIDQPIAKYDNIKEGDYVVLKFSDEGVGMSEDDMDKIFDPFYTKKKMGKSGTGLGMTVVWGTVKDYKGYIDIQSTEGKGSCFTLYFPATRAELPEEKPIQFIDGLRGNGESVLIVDDITEQREILTDLLEQLDYDVRSVGSGEEAVDYMKRHSVDILILDMIMDPGINGRQTYEQILKIHPNPKAIIASGFSETQEVKITLELGAAEYIKKPYTLEKIGQAIKEELKK